MTLRRTSLVALATVLFASVVAHPLSAQVGSSPASSPFRDISSAHTFTPLYGHMWGSGGTLGVAAHDGSVYGFRVDTRVSAPLALAFQMSYTDAKRNYFDLKDTTGTALRGSIKTRVIQAEVGIQINLTGKKAWHRLAPYVGINGGLAFGQRAAVDSSGFNFGTKFVFAPMVGTRVSIARGVLLRAEWRWNFWQLKYPTTYSVQTPGGEFILGSALSEWVATPQLSAGLSIGF